MFLEYLISELRKQHF